jgi:hypothetical protein
MATHKKSLAQSSLNPRLRVLIELLARIAFDEIIAQNSTSVADQSDRKAA